jgi:5-methyltetrahydropteroyltriglutamate--homocysteine methyltransferase
MPFDRMVPPGTFEEYRRWGEVRGIAQPRARGHPEDACATTCWGSWPGPHVSDVPLRDIADLIPKEGRRLRDRPANPRHEHERQVKNVKLPDGKVLIRASSATPPTWSSTPS